MKKQKSSNDSMFRKTITNTVRGSFNISSSSTKSSKGNISTISNERLSKLTVHGYEFSNEALLLNPEVFPDVKANDIFKITQPGKIHPRLLLQVGTVAPVKGNFQVSILKEIAALFNLEAFHEIFFTKIDPCSEALDFVELTFKDQFLSRADIWQFKVALCGKCLHHGKNIEILGIRAQVKNLLFSGDNVTCGIVGPDTKLILRSKSSRIVWLIQMSTEMWEYSTDGELYFERLLHGLIKPLLKRWQESLASHALTIILFSRSFYEKNQFPPEFNPLDARFTSYENQGHGPGDDPSFVSGYGPTIHIDFEGKYYEDFYKVVVEDYEGPDWEKLVKILKKEFISYGKTHRWRTPDDLKIAKYQFNQKQEKHFIQWETLPYGIASRATNGNFLEAINVTLNMMDKHYMDRDFNRTGQSIVMISAGSGVFLVERRLAQITKQRMMDNGIGMDMISLDIPPLHLVPLFIWQTTSTNTNETSTQSRNSQTTTEFEFASCPSSPISPDKLLSSIVEDPPLESIYSRYNIPHWINISFLDLDCTCKLECHENAEVICRCVKKNQFVPLPFHRMFDMTTHLNHVFPTTLKQAITTQPPIDKEASKRTSFCPFQSKMIEDSVIVPENRSEDLLYLSPFSKSDFEQHDENVFENPKCVCSNKENIQTLHRSGLKRSSKNNSTSRIGELMLGSINASPKQGINRQKASSLANDSHFLSQSNISSSPMANSKSKSLHSTEKVEIHPTPSSNSLSFDLNHSFDKRRGFMRAPPNTLFGLSRVGSARDVAMSDRFRKSGDLESMVASGSFDAETDGTSSFRSSNQHPSEICFERALSGKRRGISEGTDRSSTKSMGSEDTQHDGNSIIDQAQNSLNVVTSYGSLKSTGSPDTSSPSRKYFSSRFSSSNHVVNPFQTELYCSKRLTSNRRRWSHLFPPKETEFKLYAGPNWKSLTIPAVLPLTTDYYPQPNDLHLMYTESFYTLTLSLPDEVDISSKNKDHKKLVNEMVCQRLAKDFQLVATEAGRAVDSGNRALAGSTQRGPGGESHDSESIIYHLSMGHRIHQLIYDQDLQTVEVKQYLKRTTTNPEMSPFIYRYSLHVSETNSFHPLLQEFHEYPTPAYNWNFIDQILCGYYDDLNDTTKAKRIRFCILPPYPQSQQIYDVGIKRFIDFLRTKLPSNCNFEIPCTNNPTIGEQVTQYQFKVPIPYNNEMRNEWIVIYFDRKILAQRTYHIEIRWFNCTGKLVEDFIYSMIRKSKQCGLELKRIPEYFRSTFLQLHPLVTPTYLPFQQNGEYNEIIFTYLIEKLDYVFDECRLADRRGIGCGLGIDRVEKTTGKYRLSLEEQSKRAYQQFLHRTLPVFVRVIHSGIVWIPSKVYGGGVRDDLSEHYQALVQMIASICAASYSISNLLNKMKI